MSATLPHANPAAFDEVQRLYLDLLKRCLTRTITGGKGWMPVESPHSGLGRALYAPVAGLLRRMGLQLARPLTYDLAKREAGLDWPADAETMVGLKRLDNLETLVMEIVRNGVVGDLVETGVW